MRGKIDQDAAALRARSVAQLYDDWRGHYLLRQLVGGKWHDVRPLNRDEAMTYRTRPNEALELVYDKTAVLRDVANAIMGSGYASRPRQARSIQIKAIAQDVRLNLNGAAKAALIEDVMTGCNVSRANARKMICMARKVSSDAKTR